MKTIAALIGLGVILSCAFAMTANYNVIVAENGNALVVVSLNGQGTINLPLPVDVVSPDVKGAIYVQRSNGIDVSVGSTQSARVIYHTSVLTEKADDKWNFEMDIPAVDSITATLSLPSNAALVSTIPPSTMSQIGNSKNVVWAVGKETGLLKATYYFKAEVTDSTAAPTIGSEFQYTWVAAIVVIAAGVGIFFGFKKKDINRQ